MSYFSGNVNISGRAVQSTAITTSTIDMNAKPITSVADPTLPQDAATKYYVDAMQPDVSVILTDDQFVNVPVTLKPGSLIICVSSTISGNPTSTFSVSKSSLTSTGASVMRITGTNGIITHEQLQLQWPPGSNVQIRKTGMGSVGTYVVHFVTKI